MNINDIAKLAGVSISTVSKVINNKDEDINIETRNKVQKIVKEYNYVPYGSKLQKGSDKSYIVALLLKQVYGNNAFIDGVLKTAKKNNYAVMIFDSNNSLKDEGKNASSIIKHRADAVIWEPVSPQNRHLLQEFEKNGIQLAAIHADCSNIEHCYCIDYEQFGQDAANLLLNYQHTNIGCVLTENSYRSECILSGIKRSFFEHSIPWNEQSVIYTKELPAYNFAGKNFTACICSHADTALTLYSLFQKQNLKIPADLSLITFKGSEQVHADNRLSLYEIPYYSFGEFVSTQLFALLDKNDSKDSFRLTTAVNHLHSIDLPRCCREKGILIVGSANIDTVFNVDSLPQPGKTFSIDASIVFAGGKGVNQAVGVSKFHKKACLLCRIGQDHKSSVILQTLEKYHVDTDALIYDNDRETGDAYIHVDKKGDSTITIVKGANNALCPADVMNNEAIFANAKICLLQTEIPQNTVLAAAKMAKKHEALTILKPSTLLQFNCELFSYIDIIIPNEMEADQIYPNQSKAEQAQHFLDFGIESVIITMGGQGCYFCDKNREYYFHAPTAAVVDATGASDAFISVLAVYLSEDMDIIDAIDSATAAAGYCISKFGVADAMVDRETLEKYRMNLSYRI